MRDFYRRLTDYLSLIPSCADSLVYFKISKEMLIHHEEASSDSLVILGFRFSSKVQSTVDTWNPSRSKESSINIMIFVDILNCIVWSNICFK